MLQIARRVTITLSYATAILIVGSCAKTENGGNGPDLTPATVDVGPASPSLNAVGATVQLTATVKAADGSVISGASVTWAAASGSAASVSATGLVTAVANGTEQITATAGSASGNVTVTVAQVPAGFTKVSGDAQGPVLVGTQLVDDLMAQVNDANDNPIEGVDLEFKVAAGGGSVTTTTGTSDASGQLSTTWTLGTTSGQQDVTVEVVANAAVISTFTADSDPDTPVGVAAVSGSGQSGLINQPLANPLVAKIEDQYGNGVPGIDIDFTITSGGGSVAPAMVTTDQNGEASTVWTLGSTQGVQDAEAQDAAQNLTAVMFTAVGGDLTLTSVSPDPMVEGATATFTGTNFDPTLSNNTVMIDGVQATVTSVAVDRTTMDVTVPMFNCQPARAVDVTVALPGGFQTPTFQHDLDPDEAFVNLNVGEFTVVQDPANFCLQFAAQPGSHEYLIGVQSAGDVSSALTPVVLTGTKDPNAPFVAPRLSTQTVRGGTSPFQLSGQARRFQEHGRLEAEVYERSLQLYGRMRGSRRALSLQNQAARIIIDWSTVNEGDKVLVRVPNPFGNLCTDFQEITATVRKKAATRDAIWLSDDGDLATDPFTDADFTNLADQFDNDINPPDVAELGPPEDTDNNGAIVIVFTNEVNKASSGLLGFVTSGDLFPRTSCAASNEGEYFYEKSPDQSGYDRTDGLADAPFVIAHEYAHVIQQGRRNANGAPGLDSWLAEGQATLAEEAVGHSVENRALPVTNLGVDQALNDNQPSVIDWYGNAFVDIGRYHGFINPGQKAAEAPWECGWLSLDPGNTCAGNRKVYGTPWSLLRFISDQYRGSYPGGEPGIQQAIIDDNVSGYPVLRNILSTANAPSLETVLAHWAMMLYVDGRVGSAATEITLQSWDIFDVYNGTTSNSAQSFLAELRLTPFPVSFGDASFTKNVRDGSSFYGLLSGTDPAAFALKARDMSNNDLPSKMQMFIVKTQ